jgi:hypothetical protein
MAKLKKDPIREDRIQNEAIVDAYGPEEQALGWYYYLENKIRFPFQAKCIVAKAVSILRREAESGINRIVAHRGSRAGADLTKIWAGSGAPSS